MGRPPDARRRGVDVRAGAVREARQAAGLTLAGLAGGRVTRQAVHQIETGRVRPTRPLLHHIAKRTGRPLEFFLAEPTEARRDVDELERRFLMRDLDGVVELGEELLGRPLPADEAAAARLWMGAAEVGRDDPDAALPHLLLAEELAARDGDGWLAVEAADWIACALNLKDAPGALARAERALADCRALSPVPRPTEARILGHIAAICVARRQWRPAVGAYESALEVWGEVQDPRQLAMLHHNLSIAYQRLGHEARARRSAERALALYGHQSDLEARLRMQNDLGDLLLRLGDHAAAGELLRAALTGFEALGTARRGRNFALLGLAELALIEERWSEARRLLDEAAAGAAQSGEPVVAACAHQLRGKLILVDGDVEAADTEYLAAIAGFEGLEQPERAAAAHFEYGEALEAQGRLAEALVHLKAASGRGHRRGVERSTA